MQRRVWVVVALLCGNLADCTPRTAELSHQSVAHPAITDFQAYIRAAGFAPTGNFRRRASNRQAYYRCYYTGKLELPRSYAELRFVEANEQGCKLDTERYDVFFYRIEAVASGDAPITKALEETTPERMLMVVAHEDFHNDPHVESLPAELAEAAATLTGLLALAHYDKDRRIASPGCSLESEAEIFYRKSLLVNQLYEDLRSLYEQVASGQLTRAVALEHKRQRFERFQRDCAALPRACTFDPCLAVPNNAGLAFEVTYTRFYPPLFEAYRQWRPPLPVWVQALRQLSVPTHTEPDLLPHTLAEQLASLLSSGNDP